MEAILPSRRWILSQRLLRKSVFAFRDVEGLKRACIRHVKAQTLLDLTACHSWIRFCDVHYRRLDDDGHECEEVTVIFLIDVSELIPSAEEWPAIWKEQNEWKKRAAQADILPVSIYPSSIELKCLQHMSVV